MIHTAIRFGSLLLLAVLLPALPSAGAEKQIRVPGVVTLADGTTHLGFVRTTNGKPLRLFDIYAKRRVDFRLDQVLSLRIHMVHEEQYRVWRWVEDGSREKEYTGESYPTREYETEVVLSTGELRRGHLTGVLYVYPQGKKKPVKFILRHKDKGEIGETLSDLNYVESVVLENRGAADGTKSGASIRLTVTPAEDFVTAHALPRGHERPQEAWPGRKAGVVRFASLLPDVYDLAVVANSGIHVGLAVGGDGGKPVDDETMKALAARAREIEDFYETKSVLAAVRSGDRVRALVFKSRKGKTSLPGDHVFRRWEIWSMHKAGDRWLVDHRAYVFREHGADLSDPRKAVVVAELAGRVVKSEITEVEFAIPGEKK